MTRNNILLYENIRLYCFGFHYFYFAIITFAILAYPHYITSYINTISYILL